MFEIWNRMSSAVLSSLGMSRTAQQECFGDAFLMAVASVAGCATSFRRPDDDSIDWTLSCGLPRRPKLDVQMKTTIAETGTEDVISYALKRKNYDDLILTDLVSPRILVLVLLPRDLSNWLALAPAELVLCHCAYWVSVRGKPSSDNETTVTIHVPRVNLFTPESLHTMMDTINEGGAP